MTEREYAERVVAKAEEFRDFLNEIELAGFPRRATELQQLQALIIRYPDEAREMLAGLGEQ